MGGQGQRGERREPGHKPLKYLAHHVIWTPMLWVKALHIVFVIAWFAGLFYLPRLFVYHAQAEDAVSRDRFKVMERKLYRGIMVPAMVLTLVSGTWLWLGWGFRGGWLAAKLGLVAALIGYHFWLKAMMRDFERDANRRSHVFYRWVNEAPLLLLVPIVVLVVVKPF
jgi:putative membrane protein